MKNAVFCDVSRVALVRTDVSEELTAFLMTNEHFFVAYFSY
jgi:hypothetical protein